ncbi:MAG: thioredoxin [Gloeomargaritaceae cyanobacterium C42_A2020_066]|nr:thioredoxin [Gloeomargaritaceae cyanobacterium C42_A2020_066]
MATEVIPIRDGEFQAQVLEATTPVLVYVWADWCGPCRLMAPLVDKAAQGWAGRLKVVKMHVDENPELARLYQVEGIPTLLLFREGQLLASSEGLGTKPAEFLTAHL